MSKNSEAVKKWMHAHRKLCPACNKKLIKYNSKSCNSCSRSLGDITIGQAVYTNLHKSSAFALIRSRARSAYSDDIKNGCCICGYKSHVEVCHIRPISHFDVSTKISVVNSRENIVILCPNHHWEFDNGLLKLWL